MDNMSSVISNSYRQYKRGTEAMFTWLSDFLDKTGTTLDRSLEDSSIRCILALASQAEQSGATMPYEVLCAIEEALKIHRQYHAWYSRQLSEDSSEENNKGIKQSNETHKVFINFLQCIHDLFAPAKTSADQVQPHTQSKEKILEVTNFFAILEVDAVTEEEAYHGTINYSSGAERAVKPWMVKKSQMFNEDKFLELYCLYEDANKIREYLRKKWAEYASRKIDIKSAALTTQVALELFS